MKILPLLLCALLASEAAQADPVACRDEVGHETASTYVRDCLLNSGATHPPCNEINPCWMMVKEVVRNCDLGGVDAKLCEKYKKLQTKFPTQSASQ